MAVYRVDSPRLSGTGQWVVFYHQLHVGRSRCAAEEIDPSAPGPAHWDEVENFARSSTRRRRPASSATSASPRRSATPRVTPPRRQIRTWKAARAEAERDGDQTGLYRAEQELKEAHTSRDELDLFRKNLQSFVRSYEFLSEIIDQLNDLFGAEVSDEDKLHFANGVADRIRCDESVMAQVENHSPDQVMHGLFPSRVTDTVLDAMTDHEKLAMQVLDDPSRGREFALLILRLLTAGNAEGRVPTRSRS